MDSVLNILDFPNELLIEIFTYLLPSDRRVASECCKRFLEIWLLDDFIEDRRLVFFRCLLDSESEPGSVFLQSTRKYDKIVLNYVNIGKNINELWKKWGETVTSIDMKRLFSGRIDWFAFKKLKEIKVASISQLDKSDNVPNGLDRIIFENMYNWMSVEERNKIEVFLNSAKSIEINNITIDEKSLLLLQNHQTQIEKLGIGKYSSASEFAKLNLKNLKHLIIYDLGEVWENWKQLLENWQERFPKLEHLELTTDYNLPTTNWTCLKTLTVVEMPLAQLTRLNLFVNLEKLDLEVVNDSESTCFFTHNKLHNTNLKELSIEVYIKGILCDTCFENLTLAFPNLVDLQCGFSMSNEKLKQLQKNSPKLKRLSLWGSKEILSFAALTNLHELTLGGGVHPDLTSWPMMPHLRKLRICYTKGFDTITRATVKIFEKMPCLEQLDFTCSGIDGDAYEFINEMTKPLKRLRTLKFPCNHLQYDLKIVDILAQNCKYLRTIQLGRLNLRSEIDKKIYEEIMAKYWWIKEFNGWRAYTEYNDHLHD